MKQISTASIFAAILFGVFLLQQGVQIKFWMLAIPHGLDALIMALRIALKNSAIETKYYSLLGKTIFKIRFWQVRRQMKKDKNL